MASVVRNERRGTWQVQWHDGAKWVRVTVAKKRPGWKPGDGLPKKPPAEVVAALAEYRAKEDAARARPSHAAGESVAAFLAAYEAWYALDRREGSCKQLGFAVRHFLAFCAGEKVRSVRDVTPELADRFASRRLGEVKPVTARKDIAMLSGAWTRAVRLRALTEHPWRSVVVPGRPVRRTSSWTPEEYGRLLGACRPWLRNVVTLGCNTGLRVTALTHLEWSRVEWNRTGGKGLGQIRVAPEWDKAKTGYVVPMSQACHDLLARLDDGAREGVILRGQSGRPIGHTSNVRDAILSACRHAGLPRPDSPCHAMRRTFGRWAVQGHLTGTPVPIYFVSKWMGHHSVQQTEWYLDLSDTVSQEWMVGGGEPPEGQGAT